MKLRMLILAVLVMVFAATSFGQSNVNFLWADASVPTYWYPLTYCPTLPESPELEDGTIVKIYKKRDPLFAFPDPALDSPVPIGPDGGAGQIQPTNEFAFNSADAGATAPCFYVTSFIFNGGTPGGYYYLVIGCYDGETFMPSYYSATFQFAVGYNEIIVGAPDDYGLPSWTHTGYCCEPPIQECIPSDPWIWTSGGAGYHSADVDYYPENLYFCVDVCAGMDFLMTVVGNYEWEVPEVHLLAGCANNCNDPECTPAVFTWNGVWTYEGGNHVSVIEVQEDGCICIELDDILPVELSNFDAVAGDKEVKLAWSTASETDIDGFEIVRDNVVVHRTDAGEGNYSWIDSDLTNGRTYSYELVSITITGDRVVIGDAEATPSFNAATITEYALHQNFPNPFNPTTSIVFDVVESNHVTLTVYNAMGQEVSTLVNGIFENGRHNVEFSSDNLTSGLYFYNVKIGNEFTATKKMLLVK